MVGLSFQAEGLFPRKGIDMWIRGTVRLTVVALLGVEISIIALASAASAATHPGGSAMPSSNNTDGPTDWDFEVGPHLGKAWAFERLMMDRTEQAALPDWPMSESADAQDWPMNESADTQDWPLEPTIGQRPPRPPAIEPDEGLVHIRVARIPRARPQLPRKRARAHLSSRKDAGVGLTSRKNAGVDLTRVLPRQGAMHMSHITAAGWLKGVGVKTKSSGNCTSKQVHHCTSLDSVRTGTIAGIIELKRESGCPIMVTGGTEAGHAPGVYSHGNGYKLDIAHNGCIDQHITKNHEKAGVRSDGARLYRADSGTVFADERDHWDILFR
ncbi:hypothetical protein [Nonomuraea sp. CA-141351]|uniref:hypothetical protein n=1 Tax=Nonomuraea sp. CA-141351 TaxID=3239996 RepID=UPI003D90547B